MGLQSNDGDRDRRLSLESESVDQAGRIPDLFGNPEGSIVKRKQHRVPVGVDAKTYISPTGRRALCRQA